MAPSEDSDQPDHSHRCQPEDGLDLWLPDHENILYNFDSLKPNFYIVKLGFTVVYTIFLISAQNIDCGYSLEPLR